MRDGEAANVQAVIDHAASAFGRMPLSDPLLADLTDGIGITLTASVPTGDKVTGIAQVSRRPDGWTMQLVVDSDADVDPAQVRRDLASRSLAAIAAAGGGRTDWWVFDATDDDDRPAIELGFTIGRDLLQMRRQLPAERTSTVATRPFVVGQDESAWLGVNNRAFAGHPEQSGWTIDTLRRRIARPWFDPAGLLLHERDGILAAFCWTKMHTEATPQASSTERPKRQAAKFRGEQPGRCEATPGASSTEQKLGEIYVIGVDPDFQGLGLGSELTLAGLEWLHGRGANEGMLYVDGANTAAQAMYERLGFAVTRRDRAYHADIPSTSSTSSTPDPPTARRSQD